MKSRYLLNYYLSNLQAELFLAHCSTVHDGWRDIDYTPDYSKLYFFLEGSGWVRIGDQEFYPKPGQFLLMPEGVCQSYSYIGGQGYRKFWCHFSAKVGEINLFQLIDLPFLCTPRDPATTTRLFDELVHYTNSHALNAGLLAKARLLELLSHFVSEHDQEALTLKHAAPVQRLNDILDYIHRHIHRELTIAELAAHACLHPNYFIRMFKAHMGMPPIQYIGRKKMDKAKELLAQSSYPIAEIGEMVGFRDMYHFSKQFKKITGLAPSDYRKQRLGQA
ncbi:AraC family transcriptional regulator [Paenibacillus sp. 598K]|uniref:AraC family transcriptional regulator n=1 Tax=Paenibacillus sp. 598K TaxID=1117987 RepID=UPI000FFA93A3|nr:AraC family transcriptional regulator [Paenibacillus sp. 598K]GBF75279.1 AraC family transcriptional regulator [Paenibacillus sp. 598K]